MPPGGPAPSWRGPLRRWAALLLAACALMPACAGALPRVTPELVAAAGPQATAAGLESGRALYVERCGSCHRLYGPASLTARAWPAAVRRMAAKARIDRQQEAAIVSYLLAARETLTHPRPPAP